MRHSRLLLIVILLLSTVACSSKHGVRVDFGSLENDTLLIVCRPFSHADDFMRQISDTLLTDSKGILEYTLPVEEPCIISVRPFATSELINGGRRWMDDGMINLYVTPCDRISVEFRKEEGGEVEFLIKKNNLNKNIHEVNVLIKGFHDKSQKLAIQMNEAYLAGNNVALDSLRSVLKGIKYDYIEFISMCFRQRLNCEEAPYIILLSPVDSVESYLAQLPQNTLNGMFKPLLAQVQKKAKEALQKDKTKNNLTIGAVAPNFALPGIDGKEVTLSDFKGKTVLLDFWGTWCYWCKKGIPDLKKASEKYGDRLVILSIDCKDSKDMWLEGVEKYGMDWINVREDTSLPASDKPTVSYNVTGFPTKFIIDRNGKIRDITEGEDPKFYDRLDAIMTSGQSDVGAIK